MERVEELSYRQSWLLLVIDSVQHIDGTTRLQKYGLLASKLAPGSESAYDDWTAHNFGAYSPALQSDNEFLVRENMVKVSPADATYGSHSKYSVSKQGKMAIREFKTKHGEMAEKIRAITAYYHNRPLDELLADAYSLFPEYTGKSTIRGRVRASIMKRDTGLSAGIRLPYTEKKIGLLSITDTAKVNQFPYNDEELRKELAEHAGLAGVPPTDPKAYGELSEVFADKEFLDDLSDDDIKEIIGDIR